jgi:hypothetical protein
VRCAGCLLARRPLDCLDRILRPCRLQGPLQSFARLLQRHTVGRRPDPAPIECDMQAGEVCRYSLRPAMNWMPGKVAAGLKSACIEGDLGDHEVGKKTPTPWRRKRCRSAERYPAPRPLSSWSPWRRGRRISAFRGGTIRRLDTPPAQRPTVVGPVSRRSFTHCYGPRPAFPSENPSHGQTCRGFEGFRRHRRINGGPCDAQSRLECPSAAR